MRSQRIRYILLAAAALSGALAPSGIAQSAAFATDTVNCNRTRVTQGCGTYTWSDGSSYVGEFKGGYFDGHGVVTYADGSKFEADFQKGTARGDATFTARDGTTTSGPFKNIGNDKAKPHLMPEYPFWRSILGGSGVVLLTVIVGEDGNVTNVQVDDPSSHPDYGDAAAEAVKTWRYFPATVSGKPVKVPHHIEIKFPEPRG
jgi:TonB family protein